MTRILGVPELPLTLAYPAFQVLQPFLGRLIPGRWLQSSLADLVKYRFHTTQ
jgi:hypothetical protein